MGSEKNFMAVHSHLPVFVLSAVFLLLFVSPSFAGEGDFQPEDITMTDNCIFLDRNGEILRFVPDEKGLRHIWLPKEEISEIIKRAFIAVEDERFYDHSGFDFKAIIRALKDNIAGGKIVSGASTISQQVVRLIYPHKRTYKDKFVEILRSIRLENTLAKDEILEQYLNRVPMGNNIIGIELASAVYFNKRASDLSAAEAALLAALAKAPGKLNPFGKNKDALLKRKDDVLIKMAKQDYLSEEELKDALDYKISFSDRKNYYFPNRAPHLVDLLIARGHCLPGINHTTIDLNLQAAVEKILFSHGNRLISKGATQAAVIVIHNPSMEVLASVGSLAYSDTDKGYNNGTTAFRSAGSTIKPFLYAGAIESGYTVSSLLDDILRRYRTPRGDYSPDNFDRKEYGPVTMRVALGNSLNISAVKMLESMNTEYVYQILRRINLLNNSASGEEHYGLGIVIGNLEVSLEKLSGAYAMLANGGAYMSLRYFLNDDKGSEDIVFSKETSYIISDILSDPLARMITFGGVQEMNFPFKVSLKTGTSTKYRDGWIIGYTPEYTVGIWAGNFEGTPTAGISGASGAAPIFRDIIYHLHEKNFPSVYERPENVIEADVCGISGMKPGPNCNYITRELFIKGTEPTYTCTFHDREKHYHELPANYTRWVYDKDKKVSAGGYRLKGFSKHLENVFHDYSLSNDFSGIRIRSKGQSETTDMAKIPDKGYRYSIGNTSEDYSAYQNPDVKVNIIYPLQRNRFIADMNDSQTIRLETVTTQPVGYVDWFIDGIHYVRAGPPYHAFWKLERGKHNITAVTPNHIGDSIDIIVE